jgi:hypothetical protein
MKATQEIWGGSIVVVGSFAPATFHPAWLEQHNLIRKEEANRTKVEFVHSEVALLELGWAKLQVQQERLLIISTDPSQLLPMRDLIAGLLTLLEHTPVKQLGFNREAHIRMPSEAEWHRVGDQLVPKTIWQRCLDGRVGMRSLTVEGQRPGSEAKYVRVRIEPSMQVTPHGVFIHFNEHHEFPDLTRASEVIPLIAEVWPVASRFADELMERLLNEALSSGQGT